MVTIDFFFLKKYIDAVDFNSVFKLLVFYFIARNVDNKYFGNENLRYRNGKWIKQTAIMWALPSI